MREQVKNPKVVHTASLKRSFISRDSSKRSKENSIVGVTRRGAGMRGKCIKEDMQENFN